MHAGRLVVAVPAVHMHASAFVCMHAYTKTQMVTQGAPCGCDWQVRVHLCSKHAGRQQLQVQWVCCPNRCFQGEAWWPTNATALQLLGRCCCRETGDAPRGGPVHYQTVRSHSDLISRGTAAECSHTANTTPPQITDMDGVVAPVCTEFARRVDASNSEEA